MASQCTFGSPKAKIMKSNTQKITRIVIVLSIITCAFFQVQAQTTFKQSDYSYITVAGTSTLHEWTMTSFEATIEAGFEIDAAGVPSQLKSLSVSVPIESLKSAHKAMNKNAYSALKTDKNKAISFTLASTMVQKNIFSCVGKLSIAGVTKSISIDATCDAKPSKTLNCTGKKAIKMSDFQVEAPSFMFGTVKTGDAITISFNIELSPIKN